MREEFFNAPSQRCSLLVAENVGYILSGLYTNATREQIHRVAVLDSLDGTCLERVFTGRDKSVVYRVIADSATTSASQPTLRITNHVHPPADTRTGRSIE
jgi:hypothetical protein